MTNNPRVVRCSWRATIPVQDRQPSVSMDLTALLAPRQQSHLSLATRTFLSIKWQQMKMIDLGKLSTTGDEAGCSLKQFNREAFLRKVTLTGLTHFFLAAHHRTAFILGARRVFCIIEKKNTICLDKQRRRKVKLSTHSPSSVHQGTGSLRLVIRCANLSLMNPHLTHARRLSATAVSHIFVPVFAWWVISLCDRRPM